MNTLCQYFGDWALLYAPICALAGWFTGIVTYHVLLTDD